MSEAADFPPPKREEIISNLKSLGVNVDALLSLRSISTSELRDLSEGLMRLGLTKKEN